VVTCTGPNTTDQANSAINQSPPPSVSLVVAEGATVTRGSSFDIRPNNPPFNGAIGYTNNGIVGTSGANVGFSYFGSSGFNGVANPANTFTFNNSGVQNGGISALDVGGAITGTNSGTVTGGISLRNAGSITFTNSGSVFNTGTFSAGTAVSLFSSLTNFETGSDGITRQTETGGLVTATINGNVGVPAGSTTAFQPHSVAAQSVGGVDITVNGRAGRVGASSFGTSSESLFRSTFVNNTSTASNRWVRSGADCCSASRGSRKSGRCYPADAG
jgi:hypothetical protein